MTFTYLALFIGYAALVKFNEYRGWADLETIILKETENVA